MEKRKKQIENAKKMFVHAMTTRERCNLSSCMPTSQNFMNHPRQTRQVVIPQQDTANTFASSPLKDGLGRQPEDLLELLLHDKYNISESQIKLNEHDATILHNPVYQQMQFYPHRNQLIWQEKEEQQKQKTMNDYYRTVREEYKNKLAEVYDRTIQRQAAERHSMSPAEKIAIIE